MKILLTNDDSHQSPLLAIIIENLKKFAELTIVVPKNEQSWKGKSMTRFSYLHLEEISLFGEKAYTIDGTPADCVNIAIYHLFKGTKPDLIVSGINAGLNAGLGFVWSSGTLGACFEANIAGLPGIAFSQHFDSETRDAYIASYAISPPTYERLKNQSDVILPKLLKLYFDKKNDLLNKPITWNINFPFNLNPEFKCMACSSGQSYYGSCYSPSDPASYESLPNMAIRFEHELVDVTIDQSKLSDSTLLSEGHVTITPIDIGTFAQLEEPQIMRLNKLFQ
jgi:5'-nucleotidase